MRESDEYRVGKDYDERAKRLREMPIYDLNELLFESLDLDDSKEWEEEIIKFIIDKSYDIKVGLYE